MNPILSLPGRPAVFLLWFAITAAVLLQAWSWLAQPYTNALVWLVNLGSAHLPESLHLPARSAQGIGSAFVAAIALFVATPARSVAWRLRWSATIALVLFLLHAALLTVQVHSAWASLEALRAAPRAYLTNAAQLPSSMDSIVIASAWYWLFPLCTALVWFIAMRQRTSD